MGFTPPFKTIPKDVVEWARFFQAIRNTDGSVDDGQLRDSEALSVIGRAQSTAGTPTDIVAGANGHYLRRSGDVVGFGAITDTDIPSTIARDSEVATAISDAIALLNLASGTYTPTLTNVTNIDASTAYECQYLRVGSVVHVSGRVDIDPTAAAATELGISLPVASNMTATSDLAGTAFSSAVQEGGGVLADTTNDRASVQFLANDTSNRAFWFSFTYEVK